MSQQKKKSELIHFIHFFKWHRLFLSMEVKMESYQVQSYSKNTNSKNFFRNNVKLLVFVTISNVLQTLNFELNILPGSRQ